MTTPYIDPQFIFASDAPTQDKPPAFNNYVKGMGETRSNDGRPTIKQFNFLFQQQDFKFLYIHERGACLPFVEGFPYENNAIVFKDGLIQQKNGSSWIIPFMRGSQNLAELTDVAQARVKLDVYAKSEALSKDNNLSDVADEAEARTNLDVYSKDEVNEAITTSVLIVADATTIDKGIVRLATESDITNSSETAVVTPKNVAAMLVGIGSLAKGFRALFSARLTQMKGTNTSASKTITVTVTAHGLSVGDVIHVNYRYYSFGSNQQATDTVTVTSVTNANTFVFTSPRSADGNSSGGTCTILYAIKNNYNINSLTINAVGRYTVAINTASGITGTSFIPFVSATTADNSAVLPQPEAITSATSLTVRIFDASGAAITPQWLHIGVTQ